MYLLLLILTVQVQMKFRIGHGSGNSSLLSITTTTATFAGNVGIAITSPASTLHVLGPNSASGGITLTSSTSDNTQKVGRIKTSHYDTSEEPFTAILTNAQASDNILRLGGGSGGENAATDIRFYTAANNTTLTGTERLHINESGNATFAGNVTATNILTVAGAATGSPFLQFTQGGTQKAYIQYADSGDSFYLQSDNNFVVLTGGSTAGLTINSSQNATFAGDVTIPVAKKLYFGGGSHTYIGEDI
jgi:hypothetical protein